MRINSYVINKSIDYILNHVNDNISIDDVAGYCNFSKYHFSRMFKAETGISIYSFIKSLKMDQSAVSLKVEKDKTITHIGANYGYSSSNYSSAFSREFNVSPADFRKSLSLVSTYSPFFSQEKVNFKSFEHYEENIKIENLEDFKVICERYIGDYSEIGSNWYNLLDRYKNYLKADTLMIEKSYNDPAISSFDKSIYDLCITVNEDIQGVKRIKEYECTHDVKAIKDNGYLQECKGIEGAYITTIKGGKFAIYRFNGLISDIFGSFQGIFNVWLPNTKYERDDRYCLGIYRNIDKENNCVVMDLCIPVK